MKIGMYGRAGCRFLLGFLLLLICSFSVHSVYGLSASSSLASSRFKLQRKSTITLDELSSHDQRRHARQLAGSAQSYPLYSGFYLGIGLYYTELQIGTPPSNYYVLVDTGSGLLWLNGASCTNCPNSTSVLNVPLALYDPQSSSSSSVVGCTDKFCALVSQQSCSPSDSQTFCNYTLNYAIGTSTGYLVQDVLQLDSATGNQTANATIRFGSATTPDPSLPEVDGILGLGPSNTSIISQLIALNQAPPVFAHCLQKSSNSSGGTLVIGNVQAAGLVYTPIVPSPDHYNVNLLSIGVNGQIIPVDSSVSPNNSDTGTIVDSGTTLAYFPESIYNQLLAEIFGAQGVNCSTYVGSVNDGFPNVTLTFEGSGSIMVFQPEDYLSSENQGNTWCTLFQNARDLNLNETLLGDLILVNKLVVYDLGQNQIGWVDYDCSTSVATYS